MEPGCTPPPRDDCHRRFSELTSTASTKYICQAVRGCIRAQWWGDGMDLRERGSGSSETQTPPHHLPTSSNKSNKLPLKRCVGKQCCREDSPKTVASTEHRLQSSGWVLQRTGVGRVEVGSCCGRQSLCEQLFLLGWSCGGCQKGLPRKPLWSHALHTSGTVVLTSVKCAFRRSGTLWNFDLAGENSEALVSRSPGPSYSQAALQSAPPPPTLFQISQVGLFA